MDAQKYLNRYTTNEQIASALQYSLKQRTIKCEPPGTGKYRDNCVRYLFADGSMIVFNGVRYWADKY